jgi:hypothetical protein
MSRWLSGLQQTLKKPRPATVDRKPWWPGPPETDLQNRSRRASATMRMAGSPGRENRLESRRRPKAKGAIAASISIICYPGVTPSQNLILRILPKYLILLGAGEGIRTLDPNLGKARGRVLIVLFHNRFSIVAISTAHALPKLTSILPSHASDVRR